MCILYHIFSQFNSFVTALFCYLIWNFLRFVCALYKIRIIKNRCFVVKTNSDRNTLSFNVLLISETSSMVNLYSFLFTTMRSIPVNAPENFISKRSDLFFFFFSLCLVHKRGRLEGRHCTQNGKTTRPRREDAQNQIDNKNVRLV